MGTKYISRKKNRRGNWVKYRDDRLVTAQQSTGAAQIANLKYILKNGSTGEFVEALDSIINERVRVALGQLVNNLDKGTGLAKVLGIDASNDLGASSIANLASVLSGDMADRLSGRFSNIFQNLPYAEYYINYPYEWGIAMNRTLNTVTIIDHRTQKKAVIPLE